jgi:hypothetical protein
MAVQALRGGGGSGAEPLLVPPARNVGPGPGPGRISTGKVVTETTITSSTGGPGGGAGAAGGGGGGLNVLRLSRKSSTTDVMAAEGGSVLEKRPAPSGDRDKGREGTGGDQPKKLKLKLTMR